MSHEPPDPFADDLRQQIADGNAELADLRAKLAETEKSWRCFHCDERFTDADAAREHFGPTLLAETACQIDIKKFRAMEETHRRHCEEDTELDREIQRVRSENYEAVRRSEEAGYAKGVDEGRKYFEQKLTSAERERDEWKERAELAEGYLEDSTTSGGSVIQERDALRQQLDERTAQRDYHANNTLGVMLNRGQLVALRDKLDAANARVAELEKALAELVQWVAPDKKTLPTIEELEAILNSGQRPPIVILPNGEIREAGPLENARKALQAQPDTTKEKP